MNFLCPFCQRTPVRPPNKFCSARCRKAAKAYARANAMHCCAECHVWKGPLFFQLGHRICVECRPPEKRPRRVFKSKKKCLHCERLYMPRCNAQKFCKEKCRTKFHLPPAEVPAGT